MISRIRSSYACLLLFTLLPATPASPSAREADKLFLAAIAKNDRTAAGSFLDADFSWTARSGKTWERADVLHALASFAAGDDAEVNVAGHGAVVVIRGSHKVPAGDASVRFLRVWIQRPTGWKLLVYQETIKADKPPEKRSGFGSPSNGAPVSCDNPCETLPYKPEGAAEQEVVSMWQAVERTVLTNDVDAWIPNFTDDFLFVTPDGGEPLNKSDRVAMIKELKRTNTTLIPAEVVSMKVWVFGDTAVMRSEHKPRHGRTLHVTRIFEKHSGHWQIAFGQQTAVEPGN